MTGPTAHAALGASSAYRWMACPGSVALSKDVPRKDTVFSLEGTAAHALGELAFKEKLHPSNWLREIVEDVEVSHDMVAAVEVYTKYLTDLQLDGFEVTLEHRFSLEKLDPPAPMFGTSDCVAFRASDGLLVVADYKHGAGVSVEVEDNSQLKYYALGALLAMPAGTRVKSVKMAIIQPRAQHKDGPIREWTTTVDHLLDFADELIEAAHRTTNPNADLASGKHCRFCPAQPMCPQLHKEMQLVAADEFNDKPLVDPRLLKPEQLSAILEKADIIEDWLRSIRQHVQSQLESGADVPGWKLVPKRASRVWVSEQAVKEWANQEMLATVDIMEFKLKSPAAMEKIVGKKNLPKELVSSVSSGYTLAHASDPRPAITNTASDEFSNL